MSLKNKNFLLVVVGPTAIGKTALAIEIANHYQAEILSCDSRQFYKEMCIGTAVPSKAELEKVPHHFIQSKSIFENYSVGDFEREAIAKLEQLFEKNPIQVMVGGSGLFVNAILNGLDNFPETDPQIRAELNHKFQTEGIEPLQLLLKELDPVHYEKVALTNPQRVIRALEICIGSGHPYSSFLSSQKTKRNFHPIVIGLDADRTLLYERINQRVDLMIAAGLVEEARELFPFREQNALQTVGYRELFEYFESKRSLEETIEEIKKNTRRFAKRQCTWFKKTADTLWFDFQTPTKAILENINTNMQHHAHR